MFEVRLLELCAQDEFRLPKLLNANIPPVDSHWNPPVPKLLKVEFANKDPFVCLNCSKDFEQIRFSHPAIFVPYISFLFMKRYHIL